MQAEVSADAFEKKQSQGCQYLVLGATGYFGSHAVKWLTAKGLSFKTSSVRIESRDAVEKAIDETCPKYVLCFAGIAGRPNIVRTIGLYLRSPKPQPRPHTTQINSQGLVRDTQS